MRSAHVGWVGVCVLLAGCASLGGGYVHNDAKAVGVRYYLPRPRFVQEQQIKGDTVETTVALLRVPDLRYPQEVYLRQGVFSADIIDVQLTEHGLLKGIGTEATDKTVESVKTMAEFAAKAAAAAFGFPGLGGSARADGEPPRRLASVGPPAAAATPAARGPCQVKVPPAGLAAFLVLVGQAREVFEGPDGQGGADGVRKKLEQAKIDPGLRNRALLEVATVTTCLRDIEAATEALSVWAVTVANGNDVGVAVQALEAQLDLDLMVARLNKVVSQLRAALLQGYLRLTLSQVAQELSPLPAPEGDEASPATAVTQYLGPDGQFGMACLRADVRKASKACADTPADAYLGLPVVPARRQPPTTQECSQERTTGPAMTIREDEIAVIAKDLETYLDCLIRYQTRVDVREPSPAPKPVTRSPFLESGQAALTAIHARIELLLAPEKGWLAASRRTAWPVDPVTALDERVLDETLVHQSLRVRDRLREFAWRHAELVAAVKRAEEQETAVNEVKGRRPIIEELLRQRGAARAFLAAPVQAADAKARGLVAEQLAGIDAKLEAARTVRSVKGTRIARVMTPQLFWVRQGVDLPRPGDVLGTPGDVMIFVRPVSTELDEPERKGK